MAYVTEGESTQKSITKGVDGDIAIRMGDKTPVRRDPDAAKPHLQTVCYRVDIVALTYPVHSAMP